jgi:amino acid adenylation domain-containing protein
MDGESLQRKLAREQITIMQATPITWQLLLESGWQNPEDIKVLCGGEAFNTNLAKQLLTCSTNVWNLYGPTETTIWSTSYKLITVDKQKPFISIGKPIGNTQVYVLNKHLQLVPIGIPGELYIAGDGVARGYYHRESLTAEKFIANPFSTSSSNQILYKTGDLVRWLPDGNLEYIERLDTQTKIRGFRIELGEIEAAMQQIPEIKQTVVIIRQDESGDKYLAAYLICKNKEAIDHTKLRTQLKKLLPVYMVPAVFVTLDKFPTTPNGKIDRKSLPDISAETLRQDDVQGKAAHQSLTKDEQTLLSIWAEVLKIPQKKIGLDDSFFHLGGHSLLALQVINRVRQLFNVKINVHALFDFPTIRAFNEQIHSLGFHASVKNIQAMQKNHSENIPLSFAQRRFWFMMQLETDEPFYNILLTINFRGTLNHRALERALLVLVTRHQQLRTRFFTQDGQPLQKIISVAKIDFKLNIETASFFNEESVKHIMYQESHTPFDLAADQLIRFRLLQLNKNHHVLLICVHHIIIDGWSLNIFTRELFALYEAFIHHKPNSLPSITTQYVDFVFWQQEQLKAKKLIAQVRYWQNQLKNLPVFELPTDYQRPAVQTYIGKNIQFDFPVGLYKKLRMLSKKTNSTIFILLLSAFDVLLARYTNQEDVVIGSPIAGRYHKNVEDVVGCFINSLVFRSDLSGNPSFMELLQRNQQIIHDAFMNKDIPFERVVEILKLPRDQSRNPLFQIMLVVQYEDDRVIKYDNLTANYEISAYEYSRFDLTLYIYLQKNKARIVTEFSTSLFADSTIVNLIKHFKVLLTNIVAYPNKPIMTLPYLSTQENRQILTTWNATKFSYPRRKGVHTLFAEQAAKFPDNIAVVFADDLLTYAELNTKANQLARYLRKQGVTQETLVGICLDRGINMLIGLLGILKAGGTYIPIDPNYPAIRVQHMLADSGTKLLLTETKLQNTLADYLTKLKYRVDLVNLDADWIKIAQEATNNLKINTRADNLAYMIYTSGSTGKPKGVMIKHHNLTNLILSFQDIFKLNTQDRLLSVTPMSFDISGLEFYLPLTQGACCVIADRQTSMDGESLQRKLAREQITIMQATPITWQLLLESGWQNSENIKVLCGGEAFNTNLAKQLLACSTNIWNLYGPTETTIWSASYKLVTVDEQKPFISIGKPIGNTQVYVLNKHLQPVPIGISGELYIAGDGVARGYYQREALTAERFIANPFSTSNSNRVLYKTGDLVRWLPDGNLEYIERLDTQTKIRGFRIELGEIEAAIQQVSEIKQVVVIIRQDESGDKYLAAYLICKNKEAIDHTKLRTQLKKLLPVYMVPAVFVTLDKFPTTPNGKIDRKSLAEINAETLHQDDVQEKTTSQSLTKDEQTLLSIWSEVLKIPQEHIGLHEDFFDLGGYSLSALQIITAIRKRFSTDISVRNLFNFPTIAGLIKVIKGSGVESNEHIKLIKAPSGKKISLPVVQLITKGAKTPLFLIHPVGGTIFWYKTLAKYLKINRPVYAIQDPSIEIADTLFTTLEEMATFYKSVITEIQPTGPYVLGGSSSGANVSVEISRQIHAEGIAGSNEPNHLLLLDGWAFYPKDLQNRKLFEEVMHRQHKVLRKQFVDLGIDKSDKLLNLQWQRMQLLFNYKTTDNNDKLLLFKSEELLPWFRQIETTLNYWDQYTANPVELYMVPGNHETMFQEPHIQTLAAKMSNCLMGMDV